MGFPEPLDWNRNGKADTEDWIIEEEQRRINEARWKEKEEKRRSAAAEPPPTEPEIRQGTRAWITLGVSALVFLFFYKLDMLYAAMFGTFAVMLLLAVFYVLPAGDHKDDRK